MFGATPKIDTRRHPNAVAVLEPMRIGDAEQWVLARSEDVSNPIVLFVHGGPGTSQLTLMRRATRRLECDFTVVNWDQRGAGKSYAAGRDTSHMTRAQFVDDLVELSEKLLARFGQEKLLLVGHSWGSVLGVLAAARRPDLYSAYVGIGQVSNAAEGERLSYVWALEQARDAGDEKSLRQLAEIGPPPYAEPLRPKIMTERRIVGKYGGEVHGSKVGAFGVVLRNLVQSTEYTLRDRINFFRGIFDSIDVLFPELLRTDLFSEVPELRVPVYFCLGRYDHDVPSELSAKYFDVLEAPSKELVWFERSAHMPNTEERDAFVRFLIDTVRPTLSPRGRS